MSRSPLSSIITGLILAMVASLLWYPPQPALRPSDPISLPTEGVPAAEPNRNDRAMLAESPGPALTDSDRSPDSAPLAPKSPVGQAAVPVDPHLTMGAETCVKCHAGEVRVWQATPHYRTFEEMHRRPEARKIAAKLGLRSIKHEGRCVKCHYTTQVTATDNGQSGHGFGNDAVSAIAGVSCESCHGSARHWLDVHHDYGGEFVTRETETAEHRRQRLAESIRLGMRNPVNVYLVAQSCLRCHTTADEELVNVGGHSAGSLDFEFVSWSQGSIRHNFVRSGGKQNDVSPLPRLRLMFVAGMIAELEAGLRATAVATEKATYGITVAQRTARAAKRLQSVSQKVDSSIVDQILSVVSGVQLKLNNLDALVKAADEIALLGVRFAAETDGATLAPLDGFIPPPDRWK